MLLPVVIGLHCWAGEPDQAQFTTTNSAGRMPVQEAFRRALGFIKNHVNIMDPNADFQLSRTEKNEWLIRVKGVVDVPVSGASILVADSGAIQLRLASTNGAGAAWLPSGTGSAPDPSLRIRPEVALRQGVECLGKWWKVTPEAFFSPQGRISLRRTGRDEWLMGVYKCPATGHAEWQVEIKGSGNVRAYPVGLGL